MPVPTQKIKIKIINAVSEKPLSVKAPASNDGALIVQDSSKKGASHQEWQLVPANAAKDTREDEEYLICNVNSGKVLDNPTTADKNVRQWSSNGAENQRWRILPLGGEVDHYRIECVSDNSVLDVADSSNQDGAQIVLQEYDDSAESQRWQFITAEPERAFEWALQWTPRNHWNGRQCWQLVRSAALRPQPDAKPTFSDMKLVLKKFGYNEDAGNWKVDAVYAHPYNDPDPRVETNPRFLVDTTGDGHVDIVGFHPEKGVVVSPGRGDGTFEETERIPYEFVREDLRFLVDTNGNGRVDIVGFRDDGVWVSLQDDNNKFTPPGNKPVIKAFGRNDEAGAWRVEKHPRFLVDTTGNKRVDIVGFHDDGVWVSLQDDNGKFTPTKNKPVLKAFGYNPNEENDETEGWRIEKHPRFLVDTTGDGRVDIVGFHDDGVWVSLQGDNGKFAEPRFVVNDFGINQGWTSVKEHPRFLVKTTSDGHVDIIGFGSQGVVISRGNGDGGFQKAELVLNDFGSAQSWTGEKHLRYLADTTGDGHIDIIGFGDEGVWVSHGHGNGEFGQAQLTCRGFGYTKEAGGWRIDRHPRFLIDTTGNGRLDIVGFGGPGVYVARNLVRQFVTRNP